MNRETIDTWLERTLLALVIAVLAWGPLAFGAVRGTEFVVLQWLVAGMVAVWLLRLWLARQYRFLLPPTAWSIMPFLLYAVWRYSTSDIEDVARQEMIQVIMAGTLFLVIVSNLFGQNQLKAMAIALIGLGTVIAMYGIYQWLTGSQSVWWMSRPGYEGRASGTFVSPNHLAGFLEMICPIAITFTVMRGFSAVPRILFAYASIVMLIGIAATASRGGWLSIAVALVALSLVLIRKKTHAWAALALLLVMIGAGNWFYSRVLEPRMGKNVVTGKHDDVRRRLWATAAQMWKDHPWVGVGPDHFDYRYRGYRKPHWEVQRRPGRAHNDYWNTLVDWGLVGLVLVMTPLFVGAFGVTRVWKNLHRSGDTAGSRAALVLGASIGLVGLLVHSFFDFNMHIPANAFLAATLLAIITAHWRFATQSYWFTARWPIRLFASLILAGAGWYQVSQAARHTSEVRALAAAEKSAPGTTEIVAALEQAFRVEPKNAETALSIGEHKRLASFAGRDDYRRLALEAIEWFKIAARLNQWDPNPHILAGMCLDWIGNHAEAETYFRQALKLDRNHWRTRAMMGWHFLQAGQYAEVRTWMQRSIEVEAVNNPLAYTYQKIAEKLEAEEKQSAAPQR